MSLRLWELARADGAREVHDSWAIATYLDEAYRDRPPLFEGPQARARAPGR